MPKESLLRTALFISGGGTTAETVIRACQSGKLTGVEPVAIISSSPDATGIQKGQALGVDTYVVQRKEVPSPEAFGDELLKILNNLGVDLVYQNGWLIKTPLNVIDKYQGKIINQHPGPLDPERADFGGRGMYGARVACARIAYSWVVGDKNPWTEATTHHVTENYDKGDLIKVTRLTINELDQKVTIAELGNQPHDLIIATKGVQAELLPLEHENVIATLRRFAEEGTVSGYKREKPLIPEKTKYVVYTAKQLASQLFPKG